MSGVVAGVDGSEGGALALRWALHHADLRAQPLTAVMAWGWLDQRHADGDEFDPHYGEADAEAALQTFVERALGPADAAQVQTAVVDDLPAPGLLGASAGADLVVVGARGLGGFKGLVLGSVSQQVVHHATVPVAVVRDGEPRVDGHDRMVVGVDGSPEAKAAFDWALAEARARGACLEVVHALELPLALRHPFHLTSPAVEAARAEGDAMLDELLAGADPTGLPGEPLISVLATGAANALLDTARNADLLVVGSRGRGGFKGLLLGSVSDQVVHHASCPVVVVRPTG